MYTDSPTEPPTLHVVSNGHTVAPHVILPLSVSQHSTQDTSSVDTHPHVHLNTCVISHFSEKGGFVK